ncbi:MAG: pantoate--beta-alanine ligase [Kangiellaceae bacterium]|nr:pantoate--beta-alanine ligase [Kangiellaceae bacterium]
MKVIQQPLLIQKELIALKNTGKRIGLIPTMGNLHKGHLSLFQLAQSNCDVLVGSIFVNPMQFGANEDLDKYPRTLENDIKKLTELGVDYLFTPTEEIIYPIGTKTNTSVEVNRLTSRLCGYSRPEHFRGVATVVNILFNILQPDVVVFGKKDYQQYLILSAMVKDLFLPIEIIGGDIVREENGLAMSSRNKFLTEQQKEEASSLRKILLNSAKEIEDGILNFERIKQRAIEQLKRRKFKVDYLEICNKTTLEDANKEDKELLIACAAWLGKPRLLDNIEVSI